MTGAERTRLAPRWRRVAIIHYWLVTMRGGERVLERLIRLFPDADIFTHVYNPDAVSDVIRSRPVKTTFIDKLPASRSLYQKYLPLMPYALERLDLTGYDLVISCESGPAKGVIPPPDALHVCYTHSPMRYLWDQHALYRANAGRLARFGTDLFFKNLRAWDVTTAQRVDRFAANSQFVARRIEKYYRRDATVIHPPIDLSLFQPAPAAAHEDYFLWCSQFTAYKRPDLAIDAFNQLKLPLVMVGQGPILEQMKRRAGPTIQFLERLPFDELRKHYRRCKALVFTAEEDFGMVPVEVMASGRPVIALGRGGVLETVAPEVSGVLFDEPDIDQVVDAIDRFGAWLPEFDHARSIASTKRFAAHLFDEQILSLVERGARLPAVAA
jgi:glycosyltransferase involved in cell wall biosynthesis